MTRGQHRRLKNCLLWANFVSNIVGFIIVYFLIRRLYYPLEASILKASDDVNMVFTPGAFLLVCLFTLLYERPIRRYLDLQYKKVSIPAELAINARRKLLNKPFFFNRSGLYQKHIIIPFDKRRIKTYGKLGLQYLRYPANIPLKSRLSRQYPAPFKKSTPPIPQVPRRF
mgnify:CR=1 FL=1